MWESTLWGHFFQTQDLELTHINHFAVSLVPAWTNQIRVVLKKNHSEEAIKRLYAHQVTRPWLNTCLQFTGLSFGQWSEDISVVTAGEQGGAGCASGLWGVAATNALHTMQGSEQPPQTKNNGGQMSLVLSLNSLTQRVTWVGSNHRNTHIQCKIWGQIFRAI